MMPLTRHHEPFWALFASAPVPALAPRALPRMETAPTPRYLWVLGRVRGIAGAPSHARRVPLRAPRPD